MPSLSINQIPFPARTTRQYYTQVDRDGLDLANLIKDIAANFFEPEADEDDRFNDLEFSTLSERIQHLNNSLLESTDVDVYIKIYTALFRSVVPEIVNYQLDKQHTSGEREVLERYIEEPLTNAAIQYAFGLLLNKADADGFVKPEKNETEQFVIDYFNHLLENLDTILGPEPEEFEMDVDVEDFQRVPNLEIDQPSDTFSNFSSLPSSDLQ